MSIASVALNLEIQGDKEGGGPERNEFENIIIKSQNGNFDVELDCAASDVLIIYNSPAATEEWLLSTDLVPINDINDYSTVAETNTFVENNYTDDEILLSNYVSDDYLTTNYYNQIDINNGLASYTDTTDLEANYVQNTTLDNFYTKTQTDNTFQVIGNYLSGSNFTSTKITLNVPTMGHNGSQLLTNVPIPNFIGSNTTAYIAKGEDCYFTIICSFASVSGNDTLVNLFFRDNSTAQSSPSQAIPVSIFAMN
jgi:hypothetical protein